MNLKKSQKHDNVFYIRKNYTLKSIYDDENECINYTLSKVEVIKDNFVVERWGGDNMQLVLIIA